MCTAPSNATWTAYLRGHDDIGWAITDEDAAAVGLRAFDHRSFLVDFHAGESPGSFAMGAEFGLNPQTRDARTCSTATSLAGVEQALERGDGALLEAAICRLLML